MMVVCNTVCRVQIYFQLRVKLRTLPVIEMLLTRTVYCSDATEDTPRVDLLLVCTFTCAWLYWPSS
jgi:hypothetical protein